MTSLYIPASVTSIGHGAFAYCSGLKDIYCYIEEPENIIFDDSGLDGLAEIDWDTEGSESRVFTCRYYYSDDPETVFNNCILHVPKGTVNKYREREMWNHFQHIVEMGEIGNGDINGSGLIDVEDVNATINIILKLNSISDYPGSADMNGDGVIDVEDVNALINIILKLD